MRQAAKELFDEEFHRADDERQRKHAEQAENREKILRSLQRRTLVHAYYERVLYLFQLERLMKLVQFHLADLEASEVDGLEAVAAAREEFAKAHMRCPQCGELNERYATKCRECGKELSH